jgi:two-component system chemotaxis sensor kinase CheA
VDGVLTEFLAEAAESIESLDRALVRFEQTPDDPELLSEMFRVLHTIKGTCGFLGLPRLEAVAHAGESVLSGFRNGELSPDQGAVSAILQAVDQIKDILSALGQNGAEPAGDDRALLARLHAIVTAPATGSRDPLRVRVGGFSTIDAAVEGLLARQAADIRYASAAARDMVQAALCAAIWDSIDEAADEEPVSLADIVRAHGGELGASGTDTLVESLRAALADLEIDAETIAAVAARFVVSAPAAIETPRAEAPPPVLQPTAPTQTIRVSVDTLDQIMNVASELVLIRNALMQTLRQDPDGPFAAPLQLLNLITTELQEAVMTTRMQPIGHAWAKLPRLVRDLSVELDKRIELTMAGADTELDRQVLELIKDPLTHMIRNAADHGLEPPAERAAVGKPVTGQIGLHARHEGGHVVIEVFDDGRGLPVGKIRAKALSLGLIDAGKIDATSDAQIQSLIFAPGFSTAAAVTNVSGRGVGMDVVRSNIEKLGGTIELSSHEGQGTRFTVRIPLTLTIVSALIVECAGQRFALPQSELVELVSASRSSGRAIEHLNGAPVLRLRDRLLPLVSLRGLLDLEQAESAAANACVVVMQVGPRNFGVIVDRVFDIVEIVVKPVTSLLRRISLFSGNTILGDGAVVLILDANEIATRTGVAELGARNNDAAGDVLAPATEGSMLMLIARIGANSWKAIPVSLISRIEDIWLAQVEQADGRKVVQYQNGLMPLILADGSEPTLRSDRPTRAIVFSSDDQTLGLVVDEIVDIIESPLGQVLPPREPGSMGSVIVAGRVADLLDPAHLWRLNAGEVSAADGVHTRALIVDASPFTRNVLRPLLARAGYDVVMAESRDAAIAVHASGQAFDVILLDTALRGADDISFAATAERLWRDVPIVGLLPAAASAIPPLGAGYSDIISRFDREGLVATLHKAVDAKRSSA